MKINSEDTTFIPKLIESRSRGSLIYKTGKSKKEEKRLQLTKNKTSIAAKLLIKPRYRLNILNRFRYVTIKHGKKHVDINISSTAKRLGISRREVKKLAKKENALQLLQEKAVIQEKALECYTEILKNYTIHRSKLRISGSKEKTGLKPQTVLKVVKASTLLNESGEQLTAKRIKIGRKVFRIHENGEISSLKKTIGHGSFGRVLKTLNLNSAKMEAIKEAYYNSDALFCLENEYNILKELHKDCSNNRVEGIQACPKKISIISESNKKISYYQTTLAAGDLSPKTSAMKSFKNLTVGQQLLLCGQVIHGLSFAHHKNIVHRDIKPENCLVETNPEGVPKRFVIADWGGAGNQHDGYALSPSYTPLDCKNTGDMQTGKESDVFAMCKTIIETLLGDINIGLKVKRIDDEYYTKPLMTYIDPGKSLAKKISARLEKRGIPRDIAQVLISGLSSAFERPNSENLKKAWDDATNAIPNSLGLKSNGK